MRQLARRRYVDPLPFATLTIGLGEKDQALAWLEKAYEARSSWLIWLGVDPVYDPLRSDPRFQALLRRMKLPPQEGAPRQSSGQAGQAP